MSANYQSKLYHKIILLKPANTQLSRYFVLIIIQFTVFSADKPRDHYTIDPEMTSQIQRGLNTLSYMFTYQMVNCLFCLFCLFFPWWESNAHICLHVHSNTGGHLLSTTNAAQGELWGRPNPSVAAWLGGLNVPLEDWARWELTGTGLLQYPDLPSPNPFPPNRAGEESGKMSVPSGRFDILHPGALAALL